MGKFDGKQITGVVGNLIFKKSADGKTTIIQTKAYKVKQTKNTKKAATVMGNASTLSAAIRYNLSGLFLENYPGTMINKLTTANRAILSHCFDKSTETYAFQQDSFHNLAGFEFNTKSPLSEHLWVRPYLSLEAETLTLTIPSFKVPEEIKMPGKANAFTLCVQIGQYALYESRNSRNVYFSIDIEPGQTEVPEQHVNFNVEPGCLCVVGLGIQYFLVNNQYKSPLNDKLLNPASIIDAIIIPGQFVEPAPRVESNRSYGSLWETMPHLKIPRPS